MAEKTFYPNACYVCKKYGRTIRLKTCSDCRMISYCDMQHQADHWPEHAPICVTIQRVFHERKRAKKYMNTEEISVTKWTLIKYDYLQAVSTELKRDLSIGELQMFLYARACAMCHRQDNLNYCKNCPCGSFCVKHHNDNPHKGNCISFKQCFDMETMGVVKPIDIGKLDILQKRFCDMASFLYNCVPGDEELSSQLENIYNSDFLTKPLTLFYAMKLLILDIIDGNLVVHVIAAHCSDDNIRDHWEILLHLLPPLISLTIISIGPDLKSTLYETIVNLCDDCTKKSRRIVYEYFPMVYRDYVCTQKFKKPDIIVGFNVIPYKFYDTLDPTTKLLDERIATAQVLMAQNCPYILTLCAMPNRMDKSVNLANCYCSGHNPYKSLRPFRGILTETCYFNQHLIIFKYIKERLIVVNESDFNLDIN